jgi:acetyl esterase
MTSDPILPGRLGDSSMTLDSDPRTDPRLIAVLTPVGMAGPIEPGPVDGDSGLDALLEYAGVAEEDFGPLLAEWSAQAPLIEGVESRTEVIRGVDDNDIALYIHVPAQADGPLPALVHIHGGGMAILEASDRNYVRWRDELAATGLVVVGVEFRNSAGKLGSYPFPAGLNDCASGLQWTHAHRDELGITKIVISGESGGGNLALAATLKAKQDGFLDAIDGVYAQCPYILGRYAEKDPALPSLWENEGYYIHANMMSALARLYSPDGSNDSNPLAWPYHASMSDLEGLPPHVISVNELDVLRDEGLAYFRKLLAAGVPAASRTVNGTVHSADCIQRDALPDVYLATVHDIHSFACSL